MSKKINDPTQIEAVVFGYLIREFGKVQTSKFNKITNELGLDRVGVDRLKEISEMVEEHEGLKELVDGAIEGKYTLEDLVHIDTNKVTPYEDLDVYNVLSSYSPQHERVLEANRHFNRTQKNGSYLFNLMEDVKNDLKLEFRNSPKILEAVSKDKDFDAKLDKASLIVTLSDLHVGALNDVGYKFDYEILIKRLNKYKQEIERMVETIPGISNIRLYILGDSVEHFYMRNQQSFEAEFPLSVQIAKATRVIAEFINDMEKILPTKFGIVHGNHDRLSPDKKDNAYNDSVSYVILDTLLMLQDVGQFKNTEIIDNRENQGSFTDKVNGKNIMVLHGDKGLTSGKAGKIPQLIRDEIIDLLFTGHFHSVAMEQEDYDRLWIQVSSISGYNTYSKDLNLPYTKPSQTLIVLHEELRGPFIYPVFFD